MVELVYPLRVVFYGGEDEDGMSKDTYEVHGPFANPGALWRWANRECYLNVYAALREDLISLIKKNAAAGWAAIKMALDQWALCDLEEYDWPGASRAHVLQGKVAWRDWLHQQEEDGSKEDGPPPEGWRAIGPVRSCGCEDWPCCIHADDFMHIP